MESSTGQPDTVNRYIYAGGDPVHAKDPEGRQRVISAALQ
jgi:hypothetical protein